MKFAAVSGILSLKISISTSPSEVERVAVGFAMGAQASSSHRCGHQPWTRRSRPGPIASISTKNEDMARPTDYNPSTGSSHEGPSQDVRSRSGRLQIFVGPRGQVQSQALPARHRAAERLGGFVLQQAIYAHASVVRNRD